MQWTEHIQISYLTKQPTDVQFTVIEDWAKDNINTF